MALNYWIFMQHTLFQFPLLNKIITSFFLTLETNVLLKSTNQNTIVKQEITKEDEVLNKFNKIGRFHSPFK